MEKTGIILPVAWRLLATSIRAHAQVGGCTDSPENPTAIRGLIVGAAAFGYTRFRIRNL